jgi:hypothetical protein
MWHWIQAHLSITLYLALLFFLGVMSSGERKRHRIGKRAAQVPTEPVRHRRSEAAPQACSKDRFVRRLEVGRGMI